MHKNFFRKKPRILLCALLVIFNLLSLYFIIDIFSYDEIVGEGISEKKQVLEPGDLAYLLFIVTLFNLYFLAFAIMERAFEDKG